MSRDAKTKDMILRLKDYKAENNLTDASIFRKVQAKGFDLSESSVRRVFEKGSEDKGFRYEDTIRPIVIALFDTDKPTQEVSGAEATEIEALRQLVQLKESISREQLEEDERKIAFLKERVSFLSEQITAKDKLIQRFFDQSEKLQAEVERLRVENERLRNVPTER